MKKMSTLRLDPGLLADKRSQMLYQQLETLLNELERKTYPIRPKKLLISR